MQLLLMSQPHLSWFVEVRSDLLAIELMAQCLDLPVTGTEPLLIPLLMPIDLVFPEPGSDS